MGVEAERLGPPRACTLAGRIELQKVGAGWGGFWGWGSQQAEGSILHLCQMPACLPTEPSMWHACLAACAHSLHGCSPVTVTITLQNPPPSTPLTTHHLSLHVSVARAAGLLLQPESHLQLGVAPHAAQRSRQGLKGVIACRGGGKQRAKGDGRMSLWIFGSFSPPHVPGAPPCARGPRTHLHSRCQWCASWASPSCPAAGAAGSYGSTARTCPSAGGRRDQQAIKQGPQAGRGAGQAATAGCSALESRETLYKSCWTLQGAGSKRQGVRVGCPPRNALTAAGAWQAAAGRIPHGPYPAAPPSPANLHL